MTLAYKPDWAETQERYRMWWAHEYFGRCAISVTAPKTNPPACEPPTPPESIEARWLDMDYVCAWNDYAMGRTFYGGEALPMWHPGYPGYACHATFLGAKVTLDSATGWVYPTISDGDLTDHDYREFKIDRENRWWRLWVDILRTGVEASRGKCLCTIGAFGGAGDTLAALRDTERLLLDVIECPEYVREFDQYLMRQWIEIHDAFYREISEADGGSTGWFPLWSPGRFYASQNDFAYMISPAMFEEIFLPSIRMQTEYLDHTVHHVDGEGNFNHVSLLCELPKLQALQIGPGDGKPSALHYMDVLKKVQGAGKNLYITLPPNEVETALANLSARGLFIDTSCGSEEEARSLIACCEKWSVDRG